jgi:hypothetical protein
LSEATTEGTPLGKPHPRLAAHAGDESPILRGNA